MPGATIDLPTLVQRIRVDTSDMAAAEKRAAAMSKKLREAQDSIADSSRGVETQTGKTAERLDEVGEAAAKTTDKVDDLGDAARTAGDKVEDLGDAARETADKAEDLGDAAGTAADEVEKLGNAARRARGGFGGLNKFLKPAIYYGLSGFVAPAVTAVSALGGAGLAAAGGLAPAAGALAGLPALLGAVVSGSKAFSAATEGTLEAAKAIEEFGANSEEAQKALAGLTPEARKYAQALVPFVKGMSDAKEAVQLAALPGLTRGLKAAEPAIKVFTAAAGGIGRVLGRTGEEIGKFVGSKGFLTDLRTLAGANTKIFSNLGKSAVPLLSTFRNIAVAASPMSVALSKASLQFANFLNATTTKNKGKLTEFFDRAGRAAIRLAKALGNGIAAISRIAGIGAKVFGGSDGITTNIENAAKKFNDWTKSTKGKNSIESYFKDIKPVVKEIGLLVRDVFKGFATLSRDPNTAGMISQIRTDLLPAIILLLQKSSELAPSIINIISKLAEIIAEIDPMTLELAAGALSLIASTLATIAKYVPGFSEFVTLALLYAGIRKFPGLSGVLPGLGTLAGGGGKGRGGRGGGTTGGGGGTTVLGGTSGSKRTPRTATPKGGRVTGGLGGIGATAALLIVPQLAISPAEGAGARAEEGILSAQEIIAAYNESKKTKSDREKAADALRESATAVEKSADGFGGNLLYGINDALAKIKGEPTASEKRDATARALREQASSIDGGRGGTPEEFRSSKGSPLDKKVLPSAPEVFGKIGEFLKTPALPDAKSVLGPILGKNVIPEASAVFDSLRTKIGEKLTGIKTLISNPAGFTGVMTAALAGIPGVGAIATSGLGTKITEGIAAVQGKIATNGGGIKGAFTTALSAIPGLGTITTSGLGTRINEGMARVRAFASSGGSGVTSAIRTAMSFIPGIGSSNTSQLATRITSGLATARSNAATGAQGITARIRTFLSPIPGIARSNVGRAATMFGGFAGLAVGALGNGERLYAAGQRIVGMLASGIRAAASAVSSAMSYVGGIIASMVPGSPVKTGPLTVLNGGYAGRKIGTMIADGLTASAPAVSAAATTMVGGIGSPMVAATVTARNAIGAAAPALVGAGAVGVGRAGSPVSGPVDRSLTFQFGDVIAGPEERPSDAITRKLTTLQAAGVFG